MSPLTATAAPCRNAERIIRNSIRQGQNPWGKAPTAFADAPHIISPRAVTSLLGIRSFNP